MCNCFSANNATSCVFVVVSWYYCYCQLYSYIVKHTHTHAHSCILYVVFLVGVSIQLANIAARGAFAIETEDVLDAAAHAHALFEACGSCGTTGSWQLSQHLPRQRTLLWQRLPYQRRQIKDKQLTWLYNLFICILRHATKSNLLIANVSDAKRNYSHPHGKVATRFQVEPSSVECECVRVCVHSFKKIHSHSQFACVKQVLAWLLSFPPLLLLPASIYAHHVFSFSRMTKYRLLRCNTKLRAVWQRRRSLQLAWAMAKNII